MRDILARLNPKTKRFSKSLEMLRLTIFDVLKQGSELQCLSILGPPIVYALLCHRPFINAL